MSSLIGLVTASASTIIWQVTGARQRVDQRAEVQAEADAALRAVTNALRNTYRPGSEEQAVFEGFDETLNGRAGDRLRLLSVSRKAIRQGEPESDVYEVEFALASFPDEPLPVLTRRTDPTRDDPADGGGVVDRIASGVVSFDTAYFDGLSWQDEWPESMGRLPVAVRVTAALAPLDQPGKTVAFTRLIYLPHVSDPGPQRGGQS